MGAALQPFTRGLPGRLVLPLAGGMTDGGFAITLQTMMRGQRDFGVLAGTIIMQWPVWVGGTALGAVIGATGLAAKAWGLDVLLAAHFAPAVLGLDRRRGDLLPRLGAGAATQHGMT